MPSIKTLTPILGGSYYHIFNRGVNRQAIFFQERNYLFFLDLLKKILIEYVGVLAYCLLPNHFHLVIKVNEAVYLKNEKNRSLLTNEEEIGKLISNQFKRMFISYAMSINKQENRVGALFDAKFKRL